MNFAFFDLDDTLVDTQAALHAWAHDFIVEYALADVTEAEVVTRRARDVGNWLEFRPRASTSRIGGSSSSRRASSASNWGRRAGWSATC